VQFLDALERRGQVLDIQTSTYLLDTSRQRRK